MSIFISNNTLGSAQDIQQRVLDHFDVGNYFKKLRKLSTKSSACAQRLKPL